MPGDIVTSLIDCVEREEAEEVGNRVEEYGKGGKLHVHVFSFTL